MAAVAQQQQRLRQRQRHQQWQQQRFVVLEWPVILVVAYWEPCVQRTESEVERRGPTDVKRMLPLAPSLVEAKSLQADWRFNQSTTQKAIMEWNKKVKLQRYRGSALLRR